MQEKAISPVFASVGLINMLCFWTRSNSRRAASFLAAPNSEGEHFSSPFFIGGSAIQFQSVLADHV